MDFYPDIIVISGKEYKAQRSLVSGTVLLPYKDEPDVKQGDVIAQKLDGKEISLKVLDASFRRIGTFSSSIKNPHMLTMKVEVTNDAPQQSSSQPDAAISPDTAQPSNADSDAQPITMGLAEFIEKIQASEDGDAKDSLSRLLKNPTVKTLLKK